MPTVAPFVAAFRRRLANLPGPLRASGEASNGEPVVVALLVGGAWVDITSYTMVRDDSGQVRITYGIQGGEGSQTDRASATLQLKNTDGRFSPRNPTGPYYDTLDWRNAQIRISVPDGNGGKSYRIWGEVSDWSVDWEKSGNDVWTGVAVSGIMQRLAQGPAPERSVIYEAITDPPLTGLVAYWPCEDPTGATQIASALTNGSPITWTGTPVLAAYEGFGASDPLPTITGASLTGGITRYDTTSVTQYQMRYLLAVPAAGFSDQDVVSRITVDNASYTLRYLDIHYNDPPGGLGSFGGRGTLTIQLYDADQSPLATSGTSSISLDVRGRLLRVSLAVSNNGTAIAATLGVLDVDSGITDSTTVGLVTTQVSRVESVSLGPATLADSSAGLAGAAVGHVLVQTTTSDIEDLGAAIQPSGEAAGRRIQRLTGEEGIPFDWVGDLDDTTALGPQARQNLLTHAQEATLADGGLLYETRNQLGLGYRTRASLHSQDPALTLSYTGYNLAETPVPVGDDRQTQNILTVTADGVSATYEETDGPLGTDTIGKYGESAGLTLNLADSSTANLLDHAGWRVHLGTVDEDRFPKISVNLAHPSITPAMKRAILGLRLGDRIQITNPPSFLAPDTIDQLLLGTEESLTHFEHRLSFICAPASPYTAGVLDGDGARIDTDSELVAAVTDSATEFNVVASEADGPLWSTADADAPWTIRVGGEVMQVDACSSAVWDTFTRTESNGWGTANSGQTWTVVGSAADYAVGSGIGTVTLPTTGIAHLTLVTSPAPDVDVFVDVATSVLATGASLLGGVLVRATDNNNHYMLRVEFTTAAAVLLTLRKRVGGTETVLASYTTDLTHVAGTLYRLRLQAYGATIRGRIWDPASSVEVTDWQVQATDTSISVPGSVGTRCFSNAGNTNVNPVMQFDRFDLHNIQQFTVTRSMNGVTKSHSAGAPVSLATPIPLAL